MMLFFTGFTRSADEIERRKIANFADRAPELRAMYEMVNEGERILLDPSRPLAELGDLLHQSWTLKRELDSSVSNPIIDEKYAVARKAGAIGGKLLGAGGGGFLLMLVPPERQPAVLAAMQGLSYVPLRMESRWDFNPPVRSGLDLELYTGCSKGFVSSILGVTANARVRERGPENEPATLRATPAAKRRALGRHRAGPR